MMKNPVLYKSLVIGVIVLFIGVGIQPAVAVTPDTFNSDDDCSICPPISETQKVRLKSLLNRLEKYKGIMPLLSNLNPVVADKYQELLDNNSTRFWSFPVICTLLFPLFVFFLALYSYSYVYSFLEIMFILGFIFNCFWVHYIVNKYA